MSKESKKSSYHVSVGALAQIIGYLSCANIDMNEFYELVGLSPGILSCPDDRIPVEKYILAEDAAALLTKDPYLGLHMGQFAHTGNWSILGYMMMNCQTVGEAFHKFHKYSAIIGNLVTPHIKSTHDKMTMFLTIPEDAPAISRHCYEGYFSSLIFIGCNVSGKTIYPIEVGFAHSKPPSLDDYQRIFNCPVLFDQSQNYMIMNKEVTSTPVIMPNETLLIHFERYADEFLSKIEPQYPITRQVKKLILSYMDNENLSLAFIANLLSMSTRSLQMHLKNEGTTFSELLLTTRKELAKKYLKENYSTEDITYLLGFLDPSSFRKVFKKWYGLTPKEYKKML